MQNKIEKKITLTKEQEITFETGRIARQANGSILISSSGTQVLVAATAKKEVVEKLSFFPLSVDYIEKFYASGRIPGGYLKRENRPGDKEILTSRLIDRPIRPLFPKDFLCETQIVATLMSYDDSVSPIPLAITGTSAALHISDIPFAGPIAGIRLGLVDNEYLINPNDNELKSSKLDLIVAGSKDAILMVEACANFLTEAEMLKAIDFAHKLIQKLCVAQDELREKVGVKKRSVAIKEFDTKTAKNFEKHIVKDLEKACYIKDKLERYSALNKLKKDSIESFIDKTHDESEGTKTLLASVFEEKKSSLVRSNILEDKRIDGRSSKDIRTIECEVSLLKKTHGSSLFTRGETQSIGVVTLGTFEDAKRTETVANLSEEKTFMLHYNMPGYSVGEVKRMGAPGRREVGHGYLAEKALTPALPQKTHFPYSIRIVSEITESNGSSSMASVCSGTLAMLDAGVPLVTPVAGIAMGLVLEKDKHAILSDILGDEDHLGDMDFKVAGSKDGITALQMDMKIGGISKSILKDALEQAKNGRLHILNEMLSVIDTPKNLSAYAPRIERMRIKQNRIRDLIGPGGKNIKKITLDTGCKVDIDDDGIVSIASTNNEASKNAKRMVSYLTTYPQINEIYLGLVKKTTDFGAFVEIKPGVEGLVHISQAAVNRINNIEEVMKENDEVLVKVIELDRTGRIKLSRKDAIGAQNWLTLKEWT